MATIPWVRRCERCDARYGYSDPAWRCRCGGVLGLDADIAFEDPQPEVGIWRYRDSLPPVPADGRVTLGEGMTPLAPLRVGPGRVYAKLEFASPTGSFKDRGTAVVVTRLRALDVRQVVEDSSGNAGASLAAYCAAARIRCTIHAPAATSAAKLTQIRAYGADVVLVPGPRAAATDAAMAAAEVGGYYANHAWDPYFFEGTKTAAYEIWEQLGGRAPDRVVLPAGQGTMLLGLAKGFRELRVAGRIGRLPQLIAVQSEACAPLYEAFRRGGETLPSVAAPARTLAEGIATVAPLRWRAILAVVRESGGRVLGVPEAAIVAALRTLGHAGLFVEPTAATAFAALGQLDDGADDSPAGTTVLVLTGSGLKTAAVAAELFESEAGSERRRHDAGA